MRCTRLDSDFLFFLEVETSKERARNQKKDLNVYPFGLEHKGYNNVVNGTENKFQTFQGQEIEKDLGKNTLAYQWRDYDPAIGRFNKIDRFAEKTFSHSTYSFVKNNPIFNIEIKGDSIRSYFYDKEGNQMNSIPTEVSKMFNEEFGINVGYNSETNMLYLVGTTDSDLSQSDTATNTLVNNLRDTNTGKTAGKNGTLMFGYNLRDQYQGAGPITGGQWHRGAGKYKYGLTTIDLADFDKNGDALFVEYSSSLNHRSYNLARVFEHEYFGHGLNLRGASADGGAYTTGRAVRATNLLRRERGLSERLHYGDYYNRTIFFGDTSIYSSTGEQRRAVQQMIKNQIQNDLFMKI